jgi:hypothetical protein
VGSIEPPCRLRLVQRGKVQPHLASQRVAITRLDSTLKELVIDYPGG